MSVYIIPVTIIPFLFLSSLSVDPVTGGPGDEGEGEGEGGGRRGLEGMTDEEKEREAAKLVELMKKLNE